MTDKDIKDYCKNCDVEPPAMRFKCPECEHNTDNENIFAKDINVPSKEQIIIDGIQFNKFGDFYVDYDLSGKFQSISSSAKEYKILKSLIKQLVRKTQEYEKLKEELNFLKNNEDLLISNLQVLWGKQIAEEQGDCKNIDHSKPRTKEIYHKITEIDRTLKDVAFAQSVNIGKTKPLGDTGSPKSYRNWERREMKLLEREFFK